MKLVDEGTIIAMKYPPPLWIIECQGKFALQYPIIHLLLHKRTFGLIQDILKAWSADTRFFLTRHTHNNTHFINTVKCRRYVTLGEATEMASKGSHSFTTPPINALELVASNGEVGATIDLMYCSVLVHCSLSSLISATFEFFLFLLS